MSSGTLGVWTRSCNRVIWLEKGELRMDGDPKTVTDAYTEYMQSISGPEAAG